MQITSADLNYTVMCTAIEIFLNILISMLKKY